MKIKYKNFNPNNSHNTPISNDVFIFINLLYTIGIINKVKINADFMNKATVFFNKGRRLYDKNL